MHLNHNYDLFVHIFQEVNFRLPAEVSNVSIFTQVVNLSRKKKNLQIFFSFKQASFKGTNFHSEIQRLRCNPCV